MSDTLKSILEKYKAKGADEQHFMDKHTDNVQVTDGPGAKEADAAAKKVKKSTRKPHHGYEPGEDEEVYESVDRFSIEDIKSVLVTEELDEEIVDRIEKTLLEASPAYFMQIVDEAVNAFVEEATDEERAILDEMLSTEEGYQELVDLIFEEDDDDDDEDDEDDEDEDDDDEDVIDPKPKLKEKDSKKESY